MIPVVSEPWIVLKFGGTSVAGAQQWKTIASLVDERRAAGYRVLVVCSAISGITNALEALLENTGQAAFAIERIIERHAELAATLGVNASEILAEGRAQLLAALDACLSQPGPVTRADLLAQGEWLSSRLGQHFLNLERPAAWVNATRALKVLDEPEPDSKRAWLSAQCAAGLAPDLEKLWRAGEAVLVTQGFVAATGDGRIALLGRGGSDTSAALLASRLGAERIEIWTDVDGIYSADPRNVPDTVLIPFLAYDEALELAAGGAKVIHGRSIRAAADADIPVHIRNLNNLDGEGTLISGRLDAKGNGLRAVTCQPDMAVLLLQNLDTRQQVGFLAWVFALVADRGLSVDQVATSETTTTIAINRQTNHLDDQSLDQLVTALSDRCRVQLFADCSCVNIVGRDVRLTLGKTNSLTAYFDSVPLLMMSHSANDLGISLLVPAENAAALVSLLHNELVLES